MKRLAIVPLLALIIAGCGSSADDDKNGKFLVQLDHDQVPTGDYLGMSDLGKAICKDLAAPGGSDFTVVQSLDKIEAKNSRDPMWNMDQELAIIRDAVRVYCPEQWPNLGPGTRDNQATP